MHRNNKRFQSISTPEAPARITKNIKPHSGPHNPMDPIATAVTST